MEPVQEQIPQQQPLSMYSQPPKPKGRFLKIFLGIVLGIILITGIGGGAYFLGMKNSTPVTKEITQVPVTPTIIVATPTVAVKNDMGIPITDKTISFARNGTILYVRYKGKIYIEDKQNSPEEVTNFNEKSLTWYGLVNEPDSITQGFNEIFSVKQLPNNKSFLFVTRFSTPLAKDTFTEELTIYSYTQKEGVVKLSSYITTDKAGSYEFPKIREVSSDGKYAAFTMFGCWNCGGHTPEVMVMNLETKQTKSVGKVSFFELALGGKYSYKEYVVTTCPTLDMDEMMMGECSKDPKDLPLLTGQM